MLVWNWVIVSAPVSALSNASLVEMSDGPDGQPRARLLETLRALALDRPEQAGETDATRR